MLQTLPSQRTSRADHGSVTPVAGQEPDTVARALIAIVRFEPQIGRESGLPELLRSDALRRQLLDLAARHGVLGRALLVLGRNDLLGDLPDESALRTLGDLGPLRRRSALMVLEADRVVDRLRRAGLDPLLLKGSAVSRLYYDDPVERHHADLDLLVEETELDRCMAELQEMGYGITPRAREAYRRLHFHFHLLHAQRDPVELHWRLAEPTSPFDLSPTAVLQQSLRRVGHDDRLHRVCRPEHLLLHFVLQNIQEGFSRLSRLLDVDRIVRQEPALDWGILERTAAEGRLQAALALTLQLAHCILETPMPRDGLVERLARPLTRRRLSALQPVRSLLGRRFVTHHAGNILLHLWLIEDRRIRRREMLRILLEDLDALDHQLTPRSDRRRSGPAYRIGVFLKVLLFSGLTRLRAAVHDPDPNRFWLDAR